ncbi:MAG: cytosine permease, partial [Clostridia bacterium]
SKVNIFAVGALLILSVATGFVVFRGGSAPVLSDTLSFGAALELAIAMPLSWLPLIADYTSSARRPHLATGVSVGAYFVGSCLMYVIGLGAALFSGTSDIAEILVAAGLPVIAMIIVIFSTVTTTFLDVHSAGVSLKNVFSGISAKWTAIVVCVIGTLIAMFTPIEQYQDFLYLIGSVFAPMIAILISEYFILRSREVRSGVNIQNMILWLVGFIIYRVFMRVDIVIGSTIPVMIIVCVLCVIVSKVRKGFEKSGNQNA